MKNYLYLIFVLRLLLHVDFVLLDYMLHLVLLVVQPLPVLHRVCVDLVPPLVLLLYVHLLLHLE